MPVQRGYLHPYTNLRSTPDLCPDLGAKKRRKTRTDGLSVASTKDDSGGRWVKGGGYPREVQVARRPAVASRRAARGFYKELDNYNK